MFASPTSGGSRANPYMRQNDAHNLAAERNFRRHHTPTVCFSFYVEAHQGHRYLETTYLLQQFHPLGS